MLTFNHPLCLQIVCLGFRWICINIDKKCFEKSEHLKKIKIMMMIILWDTLLLHTKQNTQIGIIPSSPFKKIIVLDKID